jgi:hypothetical protein
MSNSTEVSQEVKGFGRQREEFYKRPLTARVINPYKDKPMRLHERFVKDGRPVENITKSGSVLTGYIRDKADMKKVFENGVRPVSHRFNETYANNRYGEAMGGAYVLQREFDDLHTVMITLKAYQYNANDEGHAYVDHLHDLLASNDAVLDALRYHLGKKRGLRFGRLSVIQPHRSGHAHIQHGLWIDGPVPREALQPAVDAHLRHCPVAREQDHEGDTITRYRKPTQADSEGLIIDLTKDLVGFDDCLSNSDRKERVKYQRLGATLMATTVNQWRPDRVFHNAIRQSQAEYQPDGGESYGKPEGIQFVEDGDVYEPAELGASGGVSMVDVTDVDADDDPLPNVS